MRISTWNIERFPKSRHAKIINELSNQNADIIALTETSTEIKLSGFHCVHSKSNIPSVEKVKYLEHENRVSIFTKFPIIEAHSTYDDFTSICVDLDKPNGKLTVYASIIGVLGNRQPYFNNDLIGQIADWNRIFPNKENICVIGDLNSTFKGRIYPSIKARTELNNAFEAFGLKNTTAYIENNVDHIVVSEKLFPKSNPQPILFNNPPTLSDHIGISIEI